MSEFPLPGTEPPLLKPSALLAPPSAPPRPLASFIVAKAAINGINGLMASATFKNALAIFKALLAIIWKDLVPVISLIKATNCSLVLAILTAKACCAVAASLVNESLPAIAVLRAD